MLTQEIVIDAQNKWGQGVVKIGELGNERAACETYVSKFLDQLYAFDAGVVLFKPTKCAIEQFRSDKAEAISYFIAGQSRSCLEDKGFALQPWKAVRFENSNMILEENRAIAMGNYFFSDSEGVEVKVEYTFGYRRVGGELKIDLHHSSLPFNP